MELAKSKINLKDFLNENAFLLSIFIMAFMYTLRFSMLDKIHIMKYVFMGMRLMAYMLVAIKFFYDFFNKKYNAYFIRIFILTMFMSYISYRSKTINYFVYYIYVIVGKDVNYLKIIKSAFLAMFVASCIVILLCVIGVLEDVVAPQSGRNRHSLGFQYAPFLSNYCFYCTLYYIYIKKNKMSNLLLLLVAIINVIIFKFSNTKSAFGLAILAILITFIVNNFKCISEYKNWYKYPLIYLSVFMPILAVALSAFYDPKNKFIEKINAIVSGRLRLGKDALDTYGVKLFGQYIKFSSTENYNIVDSAFVLYLLILGIVFFILMIITFVYFSKLIDKKKDIYLMYIFIVLLLHSTFDAQLLQLSYSYFMFVWSYKNTNSISLRSD